MALFNVKKGKNVQEARDTLGGSGAVESGVYKGLVKNAYGTESEKGALGLVLEIELTEVNKTIRQTLWLTNRDGENFTTDANGKSSYLPGFTLANDLAALATEGGAGIDDLDGEERTISVYNYKESKDENKVVPVLVDLLNTVIQVGVRRIIKPKTEKVGDDYVEIDGQTVTINEIDKFFDADSGATVLELSDPDNPPAKPFIEKWADAHTGKDRIIKSKGSTAAKGSALRKTAKAGATTAAKTTTAPKKFFGKS